MNVIYLSIAVGIIVVLVIVIIFLMRGRTVNSEQSQSSGDINPSTNISKKEFKKEEIRRKKESDRIKRDISCQFERQQKRLTSLREKLIEEYHNVGKTKTNINRNTNPDYHGELIRLFDLSRDENILYCRRYEKWLGSDTFFIILEDGIGYAPQRNPLPFIKFEEIKEFRTGCYYIEVLSKYNDDIGYIEAEDFTYDCSETKLTSLLNDFLEGYKTPFDIYFDAGLDALDAKATPVLPDIIEKIGEINKNWASFFRANYKYILCEDGVDTKHNNREACYEVENILNLAGAEDKNDNVYNACLVLKAKLMLLNNEEHTDIKKIIDTVLGSECGQFILDEANLVRRKLDL